MLSTLHAGFIFFLISKNLLRVAWSPNGEKISAGSADKFVYVWDVSTKKILYKLPGHLASVNEVDFHPHEPISELNLILLSSFGRCSVQTIMSHGGRD